jgi:hypothetical protein
MKEKIQIYENAGKTYNNRQTEAWSLGRTSALQPAANGGWTGRDNTIYDMHRINALFYLLNR